MSADAASTYARPSAIGGDARRFIELTVTLARSEFKVRYFGSVLGYLWSLMRPLLYFGVIYFFFVKILRIARGPHYGVYLLTGLVLWSYFSEATTNCVTCLVLREPLLRKVRFPRMVIPLSVSLTSAFNLGLNLIVVFVFALAQPIAPKLSWLVLIPVVFAFIVFATGFGMLLSALYVRFRDVQPIWEVVAQAWFYSSPIMYTANNYDKIAAGVQHVALASPPAMLLTEAAHALIGGHSYPTATSAAGGWLPVAIAIAIIPAVFSLGWRVFTREAPRVAENL
jgi:ABC-2 type transport system permease protein